MRLLPSVRLRWRAPAPAASWSGVRDATAFGSPCLQPFAFDDNGNVTETLGSEDCLFLNVFAPVGTTGASHLPVIVHLHGGGNVFGSAEADASNFVSHGVIVVTLNYRLGALGFVGHPALTAESGSSGEYGVLDQIAALRWVHDNIGSFGGDPGNVTLAGFSAGSFDTVALMASPLAAGLITRAAVQGEAYGALTGRNATISDAESDRLGPGRSKPLCRRKRRSRLPAGAAGRPHRAGRRRLRSAAVGGRRRPASVPARARRGKATCCRS